MSSLVRRHQNTHNSVKQEVASKSQITLSNMKYAEKILGFNPGPQCDCEQRLYIVYKRDWVSSAANIKGANKDANIYVGRSTTLHNLLFCTYTLYINYLTNAFPLVSSSVRSIQLLRFLHGHGQKTEK